MIDIDRWEARMTRLDDEPLLPPSPEEVLALIAEIRRLRGENKMLYQMVDDAVAMAAHGRIGLLGPDRVEHRKCKCGEIPEYCHDRYGGEIVHWIVCNKCCAQSGFYRCECCAWAAWDGVE